jgi:iron complex outermembrane receptor protein
VLTQEDIRRSGATSIAEVLRLAPGVEVARIDSDHWAVGIRGFGSGLSKSVLVLIDGRSVYTPLYAGVYWDVQNVPLEDVDRIEVIRGPGGTIWGANAVNGVINIITKSATNTQGTLLSVGAGNVDRGTGSFHYGGEIAKRVAYRVYGMGFGVGPEFHSDQAGFDPWQLGQAGLRADWKGQDRDTFTLQGDLYDGREGQLVNISSYSPPASINVMGTQRVSGGNLLGHWRRQLSEKSDLQVQAYYDRTYRIGPQLGESRNTFDVDFIHHMVLPWRQDFIWGLGIRLSPDNFIQTVATVDFLPHHQMDNIYSGFVQDEIGIVPNKLSLTIGTKLEDNNFSGFDAQPSARVLWTPRLHQTFWAAVTRAVRTPSRVDQDLQLTVYAPTVSIFARVA